MMDLKPVGIALSKFGSKPVKWRNAILDAVNGHVDYKGVLYEVVESTYQIGLLIVVLAKVSIAHGISNARSGYSVRRTIVGCHFIHFVCLVCKITDWKQGRCRRSL